MRPLSVTWGHNRRMVWLDDAGRPLRRSPAFARLDALGTAWGEKSAWERPNWVEANAAAGDEALRPRGWAGRHWSPAIGAECLATRDAVALFDQSSFSKLDVAGPDALRALILAERPALVVPEIEAIATPVLEELEAQGLVESEPRRGVRVCGVSLDEMREIAEMRAILARLPPR